MEEQDIVLDEKDHIVINGAIEYAQKALEYDQNNKIPEALELYQRAIYVLQNEQRSLVSSKSKIYAMYIDTYKTRIRTLQFQSQNEISQPQKSIQYNSAEITDRNKQLNVMTTVKKPMTKLIEDLDFYQSTLQVLQSFLLVFTEGGNLTTNLCVPCGIWLYTFEDETEIFYKDALNFYEQIRAIFVEQMKEDKIKTREVSLKDVKAELIEAYKTFGQALIDLANSESVIMGKAVKFGKTTKIDEYANLLKRNFAKLTTSEDKYSKKILYGQVCQNVIEDFLRLIEYVDEEFRTQSRQEMKNIRDFVYIFCEEVIIKLLLFETKLKLNVYYSKMKERICS